MEAEFEMETDAIARVITIALPILWQKYAKNTISQQQKKILLQKLMYTYSESTTSLLPPS